YPLSHHDNFKNQTQQTKADELKEHIISELKSTAEKNKLRKFEYIKAVAVEAKPFDVEI
ncbi:unnamed protein product, partial [Arabidopsis halleri]